MTPEERAQLIVDGFFIGGGKDTLENHTLVKDDLRGALEGSFRCAISEERERCKLGPNAPGRPQIITLCGSTRFTREMMREAWRLTKAGNIVIHWNILESEEEFSHGAEKEGEAVKKVIDDLYLHKVAMADEVRILNVGGYVGESTRNELAHARKLGRAVTWLEPDRVPGDLR